jgi:hypothetical protein
VGTKTAGLAACTFSSLVEDRLEGVSIKMDIIGIRKERPMCFTLVEHFIGKVPDIELNGFNDTQTGVVFCWKVFEVISIFTSVENVSLGTLNADSEFIC